MQVLSRDNLDFFAEQILQIRYQTAGEKRRAVGSDLHKQVHIALRPSLATGHRTKNPNVAGSVPGGDTQDLSLFFSKSLALFTA